MKPFTKWVGGKRQLLKPILELIPDNYNHYYELFIGGGAVLFELAPNQASINDRNAELILAYNVIKHNVEELIVELKKHALNNNKDYYLDIRSMDRDGRINGLTDVERAARLLYMLRVCFNGLYRVNSKNQFNVPYGSYKNPKIVDEDNLREVSAYLNKHNVTITNLDFEEASKNITKGDLVYLDPPYAPLSKTESFTSYTADGFSSNDQVRLRDLFIELTNRGAYVILSNSSANLVYELYQPYAKQIIKVDATRMINSKASNRGAVKEVLITNF